MKKVLSILMLLSVVAACDETVDPTIYGGTESDRTFLSFSSNVYDFPITMDGTGSALVTLTASNTSSVDRVYSLSVVEEETTASPAMYGLPDTVTIPAGEHSVTFAVEGTDTGINPLIPLSIVIKFTAQSPIEDFDSDTATLSIVLVCPIPPNVFTGEYLMTQLTPNNPEDGNVPVFNTQVVNITATSETGRRFSAVYLEGLGIGQAAAVVPFNLTCGYVITATGIDTRLTCDQNSNITLGPGETPGAYDVSDDTSFTLTMTEYVNDGGCGAPPYQVTFQFTKQ